jgi:hypothetical protein
MAGPFRQLSIVSLLILVSSCQIFFISGPASSTITVRGKGKIFGTGKVNMVASGPSDTTPDSFSFTDQTNVTLGATTDSDKVQILGIDTATAVSISGDASALYRVCNDSSCTGNPAFGSSPTTITSGKYLQLRLTASGSNSTAVSATIDVGGITDNWSVTTVAGGGGDVTPAAIDWDNFFGTSATKTITGIDTSINLELSVVHGSGTPTIEYSKNVGSWTAFTQEVLRQWRLPTMTLLLSA